MKNLVLDIQRFAEDTGGGNGGGGGGTITYDETSFGYLKIFFNIIGTIALKQIASNLKKNLDELAENNPVFKFIGAAYKHLGGEKLSLNEWATIITNGVDLIESAIEISNDIKDINEGKKTQASIEKKVVNLFSKITLIGDAICKLNDKSSSVFTAVTAAAIGVVANWLGSIDGLNFDIKDKKDLLKSDITLLSAIATSFIKNVVEDQTKSKKLTDPFGPIAEVTSIVTGIATGFLKFRETIDTYTADGIPKNIAMWDAVVDLISTAVHDTVSTLSKGIDDWAFDHILKPLLAKFAKIEVDDIDAEDKNYVEWISEWLKTFNVKNSGNDEDNNLINDEDNSKIYAKAGNDYIRNFASNVTVWAGEDNDTIFSHSNWEGISLQYNSILAGPGDDLIISEAISETIYGGKGKDRLGVYGNNTKAYGEDDDDVILLSGTSDNLVNGGLGNDIIILEGAKNATIEYNKDDGKDVIFGYDESDRINITGDYVTAASGNDVTLNIGTGNIILKEVLGKTININGQKIPTVDDVERKDVLIVEIVTVPSIWSDDIKNIRGTSENDTIENFTSDVVIRAMSGNDYVHNTGNNVNIYGNDGNDIIRNDVGRYVWLNGGNGNDFLVTAENEKYPYNGGDHATLNGGGGNDTIFSWTDHAVADGGAGNDYISVDEDSTVTGGTGSDTIYCIQMVDGKITITDFDEAEDVLEIHSEMIYSNDSSQLFTVTSYNGGVILKNKYNEITFEGQTLERIRQTNVTWLFPYSDSTRKLNDFLYGVGGLDDDNTVYGTNSDDTYMRIDGKNVLVYAYDGNDNIYFNSEDIGKSTVYAGKGNDYVSNPHNDLRFSQDSGIRNGDGSTFYGEDGDDNFNLGNLKNVTLNGDSGKDQIRIYCSDNVVIDGGDSDDYVYAAAVKDATLIGGNGNDNIVAAGHSKDVTIIGGKGNDNINLYAAEAIIQYKSGDGNDTVELWNDFGSTCTIQVIDSSFSANTKDNDVVITIDDGSITLKDTKDKEVTVIDSNNKTIKFTNTYQGSPVNNNLINNTNNNVVVTGTDSADTITNTGSYVTVNAFNGNNSINNSGDSVTISSGKDNDYIFNKGDFVEINGGKGNDTIDNEIWGNTASGSQVKISGDDGNDSIRNDGDDSTLNGGTGDDYIENWAANTFISGDEGNDKIYSSGSNVTIDTSTGNDEIFNGGYYDSNGYYANAGSNVLFTYANGNGNDKIYGFNETSTLSISGSSYSTQNSDDNVIVTVGTGKITLQGTKGKKINIDGTLAGGISNAVSIPSDAVTYNNHSYKLFNIGKTWEEAKTYCENLGGHLVAINTSSEQSIIESMISNGTKNSYWLGGYKNSNNNWQWVTNESFNYDNWAPSEPNNSGGEEDKIMIFKAPDPKNPDASFGEWNDITADCGEGEYPSSIYGLNAFGFICEWDTIKTGNSTSVTLTNSDSSPYIATSTIEIIDASKRTKAIKITGNSLANTITGSSNSDTIYGGEGKDVLNGGNGNDYLAGESGNDTLIGGAGADTFYYESGYGDDIINDYSASQNDIIQLGVSSMTTSKSGQNLILSIGSEKLTVQNAANAKVSVVGEDGNTTVVSYNPPTPSPTSVTLTNSDKTPYTAASSIENIDASRRTTAIKIKGNSLDNSIIGGSGKDSLSGLAGDDTLNGGKGNDTLTGGNGNDVFIYVSGQGNDVITDYKAGEDTIKITGKKITRASVSGSDVILKVGTGSIKIKKAAGKQLSIYNNSDSIIDTVVSKFDDDDNNNNNKGKGKYISNTTKNKTVNGTTYNDTIDNYAGGVKIIAGAGNDSIYSSVSSTNTIRSDYGYVTIDGGAGNDTIRSNDPYVSINGGAGNDSIYNFYRDVTIKGGAGNDTINLASAYNNIIQYASGDGNDIINGYNSTDTLKITGGTYTKSTVGNNVIITVGTGKITLKGAKGETINIEGTISGGGGNSTETSKIPSGYKTVNVTNDYYTNQKSKVVINGRSSDDWISNYASNVIVNGNAGDDDLTSWETNNNTIVKNVTINGGAGKDTIYSFTDNSSISGGDGNDELNAAADYVTINGGKGNDTIDPSSNNVIVYANGDGNDVITYFNSTSKVNITSGSYSTLTSGDDFIIKVGSGKMTFKGYAYLADDIEITGKRNYIEEHWFTEDDKFTTSEVDTILDNDSKFIGSDYNYDSISTLTKQLNQTLSTNLTKPKTK